MRAIATGDVPALNQSVKRQRQADNGEAAASILGDAHEGTEEMNDVGTTGGEIVSAIPAKGMATPDTR